MEDAEGLAARRRTIEHLISLLDAIRSVAEIAWRRAEQRFQPLALYHTHLRTVLTHVLAARGPEERNAILRGEAEGRPTGVLFVTSERGLCGPFNERVVTYGLQQVRTLTAQGQVVHLLCLGNRGRRLLQTAKHSLLYAKALPSLATPSYVDIESIALDLLAFVEQRTIGRLLVVHNVPVHRFQYDATCRTLFPPEIEAPQRVSERVVVKPARDLPTLTTHLLTEHLLVELYQAVIESALSEQLARVYTMRLAAENARKLVDQLTLDYNLARSHAVTQSLLEIIAGYDATAEHEKDDEA
jgi:F-type H+-transporting ATPase subunit gamma